ncbi:MAG: DegQ family serine endoprotease [Deltaproteobacteria bacterium]|nr:DegQ family serine endoprotease [Deltaproteobacteria bacterium]
MNFSRIKCLSAGVFAFIVMFAFLAGVYTPDVAAADAPRMVPENFSQLAEVARPSVVNIRTEKTVQGGGKVFRHFFGNPFGDRERDPFREFFGPFEEGPSKEFKQRSLGSGFIIDNEGFIVTNNHVVEGADQIKVRLANESEYDATVIGRDPKTDLALIKIEGAQGMVPSKMGDSDSQQVGTWVVAIGSPFGLEQTVTAGIVSAKGRIIGSGPYDDFIQTDASINPGNSGGPLINMKGEVIGINTAIVASGQGIGFAIPINMAKDIIAQLKSKGEVTRGWMGVGIQDLTPELAEYYKVKGETGVLVTQIFEGDPADKAGIKTNDIITAVNGAPVTTSRELSRRIAALGVGQKADITIMRDGRKKTVTVETAKRQEEQALASKESESDDKLGLGLQSLEPDIAARLGFDDAEKGVLVTGVESGSKADKAGVQQGDLIKEINRTPVAGMEDFRNQMNQVKKGEPIMLLLKRAQSGFIVAKMTR